MMSYFFKWMLLAITSLSCLLSTAVVFASNLQGFSDALQAVINYHPAVAGKRSELEARSYGIDTAWAGRYPTLSGQVNSTDSDGDEQYNLRLEQPVWTFGKLDAESELATSAYDSEQWDLLRVQRSLIEATAVQYAQIQGLRQQSDIAQKNINELKVLYQRIKRRSKGGLASKADVLLAQARLEQGNLKFETIQGDLKSSITELQALTQVPVDSKKLINHQLTQLAARETLQTEALAVSADIRLKRSQVDDADFQVKKERLSWTPDVVLWAQHTSYNGSGRLYSDDSQVGIGLIARFNGMGFVSKSRTKEAISRKYAAQHDISVAETDVRRKVDTQFLQRQTQERRAKSQKLNVNALTQALASFKRQYDAGHKTWMDVLNTQRELTESRLQQVRIDNDWLIASLHLAAMNGHLDKLSGIQTPNPQAGQ